MTQAEKALLVIEHYDMAMAALNKEYSARYDNVRVFESGEADANEILAVNDWYEREGDRIKKVLFEEMKAVFA